MGIETGYMFVAVISPIVEEGMADNTTDRDTYVLDVPDILATPGSEEDDYRRVKNHAHKVFGDNFSFRLEHSAFFSRSVVSGAVIETSNGAWNVSIYPVDIHNLASSIESVDILPDL